MTYISKIAILAVVTLSSSMIPAFAETDTPNKQFSSGVPIEQIQCADGLVLMQSPSDRPACIFVQSAFALEKRGFMFAGEPFDMFPIKSSNVGQGSGAPEFGFPPTVSMSRLPNINETAIVEITFTNKYYNITNVEDPQTDPLVRTGWWVSSEFEVVDSGGLEYETVYHGETYGMVHWYEVLTPLYIGESVTYRIEIRAVSDGFAVVGGLGYAGGGERIYIYLDDEETLLYHEHSDRYPEMHQRPTRNTSDEPTQPRTLTKEESDALIAATPPIVKPTREDFIQFFALYFEGENPNPSIDWSVDLLTSLEALNMTDVIQILTDAGYTSDEIDDALSQRVSTVFN